MEEYDKFVDEISKITLNCSLEEVLSRAEECEQREGILEPFYKVLYVLLEKEKYLQNKYGYHSIVLERLGVKSKDIIKRMFMARMQEQLENESIAGIDYETTLDKDFEKFFDNSEFTKRIWFSSAPVPKDRFAWDIEGGLFKKWRYVLIDRETGERKAFPLEVPKDRREMRPKSVYNVIFYPRADIERIRDVYNQKFEKVAEGVRKYYLDYKRGYLLVEYAGTRRKDKIYIYDRDFNLITVVDVNKIPNRDSIMTYIFNDGVLTTYKDESVTYRDYSTMDIIDSFYRPGKRAEYVYSEGLYGFYDKESELHGYKDLSGKVIIEPRFDVVRPFYNNVALVEEHHKRLARIDVETSLIDKNGTKYSIEDTVQEMFYGSPQARDRTFEIFKDFYLSPLHGINKIETERSNQMIVMDAYRKVGVIGNEWYVINNDKPIVAINFGETEKTYGK